jgi:hypothetical protein
MVINVAKRCARHACLKDISRPDRVVRRHIIRPDLGDGKAIFAKEAKHRNLACNFVRLRKFGFVKGDSQNAGWNIRFDIEVDANNPVVAASFGFLPSDKAGPPPTINRARLSLAEGTQRGRFV